MAISAPTSGIKELCKALGNEYTIRVVDKENVIYRKLDNGFSFEISNADHNSKNLNVTLFIWNDIKGFVEESVSGIKSLPALRDVLEISAVKYSLLDPMQSEYNAVDPRFSDQNLGGI